MKICFIDWFAYSLFNPKSKIVFGGAQVQLFFLAKELAKNKDNQVNFLTDNGRSDKRETLGRIGVHQFFRRPRFFGYWQLAFDLRRRLQLIGADIYIQRAASAETGLIALIVKSMGKKFIYMVAHDQDVNGDFISRNGWRGKLFQLGLTLADRIICQTQTQLGQLTQRFKRKTEILSPAFPSKNTSKASIKRGLLWVARAEEWKNPRLFLTLASIFPREKFTMICPPAENSPTLFKIIRQAAAAASNVEFIPQVPLTTVEKYFARAQILVSTSLSEGWPSTFIQAIKNKTPIISFIVDPDQLIQKNRLGFCANGSQEELIRELKTLLHNHHLRQKMAENGYQVFLKHHSVVTAGVKFRSICLNLLT